MLTMSSVSFSPQMRLRKRLPRWPAIEAGREIASRS
jgi:hypothetical protein